MAKFIELYKLKLVILLTNNPKIKSFKIKGYTKLTETNHKQRAWIPRQKTYIYISSVILIPLHKISIY